MDKQHVQSLFESHHSAVYGFVLQSCADPSLAEDVTQDVFLRALRDGVVMPQKSGERPWLFRIARNLLIDRWRRIERRPQPLAIEETEPIALAPGLDLRTDLQRALQRLPEADREAFLLREVAGLSYIEIGEITEASKGAIRSRIYRARRQLRTALHHERSTVPATLRVEENRNGS